MHFLVTLDDVRYPSKPTGRDIAGITRRLQGAGPCDCDPASLCAAIGCGQTWVGATFEPCATGWGEFQQQQIFALDFDNSAPVLGADGKPMKGGKRHLHEGEPGYLDPMDALLRCERMGLEPLCLYFTFSCTVESMRYRLVFDMGEPLGPGDASEALGILLAQFPEADQACRNANRLFFGSCFPVIEYWRGVAVAHGKC